MPLNYAKVKIEFHNFQGNVKSLFSKPYVRP